MLRIVVSIIALLFPIFTVIAADSTVWEPLELGFYSRIHDNIDNTVDILRKKEVSKFETFSGFWTCRPSNPWLDIEPMNEQILIEVTNGDFSSLATIMEKNKRLGTSDTDSFTNLTACLSETYRRMWDVAAKDEKALAKMWVIGIYTDGDTANSDYDIVDDVEKINSIIFAEKLDYLGRINTSKESYTAMAEWVPVGSIVWGGGIAGWAASSEATSNTQEATTETLTSLGISDVCTVDESPTSVSNIANEDFLSELENILAGWSPVLGWASYWPIAPENTLQLENEDFFHTPPCTDNFCIRVKTIPWEITLIWGVSYSIESLVDKHTSIMYPISNSNLASQRHSRQSYQQLNLNLIFKNLIPTLLFIEERPQKKKQHEVEYTQDMQNAEFEEMRKCAYVAAWLPSNMDRANIITWAGYLPRTNKDTDNKTETSINLGTLDPEDAALASCMDVAAGKSRGKYYESFATDLTELESFTTWLVNILVSWTEEQKALDKKKKY